jgi:hypothetical protein
VVRKSIMAAEATDLIADRKQRQRETEREGWNKTQPQ